MVQHGGVQGHFFEELHQCQMARSHQGGDAQGEGGLKTDDAAGRCCDGTLFFFPAVGSVVCGDDIDGPVGEAADDLLPVGFRAQGRVHLCQGAVFKDCLVCQCKVMGRCLCVEIRSHCFEHADHLRPAIPRRWTVSRRCRAGRRRDHG